MNESSHLPTVNQWLENSTRQLSAAGIPSARLDAEVLLAHTLRKPRTWLHAHSEEELDSRTIDIASARIDLRLDRVPVAYIVGHKEFYGRPFKVTTATLIPRPESESIIDLLKTALTSRPEPLQLVDVGTGSGALGITAKIIAPQLDVTLIDTSRYALAVAEKNAFAHHVEVELIESNLLEAYPHVADIIIANLPYVDRGWERSPETDHEPAEALFAENNGLALIESLIQQTRGKLVQNGALILEADPTQHEAIKKVATTNGLILAKTEGYALLFEKLR